MTEYAPPSTLPAQPEPALPLQFDFTPIERRVQSGRNTITPDRQRAFIRALAETGCVALASKVIGNAPASLYSLKLASGAESFAAAWDKAVQHGARQIRDIMVDHAINGTPEFIYKDGALVAERRVFNYRMMMWIVAHAMPEEYGMPTGLGSHGGASFAAQKLKATWQKEWEEKQRAEQAKETAQALESFQNKVRNIRSCFKRSIASEPAKRAAWELLTGPTDWSDFDKPAHYPGFPYDFNMNRPDVIVPLAQGAEGEPDI